MPWRVRARARVAQSRWACLREERRHLALLLPQCCQARLRMAQLVAHAQLHLRHLAARRCTYLAQLRLQRQHTRLQSLALRLRLHAIRARRLGGLLRRRQAFIGKVGTLLQYLRVQRHLLRSYSASLGLFRQGRLPLISRTRGLLQLLQLCKHCVMLSGSASDGLLLLLQLLLRLFAPPARADKPKRR